MEPDKKWPNTETEQKLFEDVNKLEAENSWLKVQVKITYLGLVLILLWGLLSSLFGGSYYEY